MKPIIYRSEDAGAPVLSQNLGTMLTLLKACLVTGYGDKKAAGWEIAHENTAEYELVLRSKNPMSEQNVLLLKETNALKADVTAYKRWGSESGEEKWGEGAIWKRWGSGYNNAYWVVIATDMFFYIWVQSQSDIDSMGVISFFGDAISLRNDMSFAVLAAQKRAAVYSENDTGFLAVDTSHHKKAEFPASLYPAYTSFWGDRAAGDAYTTETAILSRFALYIEIDSNKQPLIELPGALMPFATIKGKQQDGNIYRLDNQLPYAEPLVALYQPWNGCMWLHVDEWSVS